MSTTGNDGSRLPERAETLLADWPAPSRAALDWEQAADRVMARLDEVAIGSTDAALLDAPLPPQVGEPGGPTRDLDEPVLASIARAVVADSGRALAEAARDGLLAAEQERRAPAAQPGASQAPRGSLQAEGAATLQGRVAPEPWKAAAAAAEPPRAAPAAPPAAAPAPAPLETAPATPHVVSASHEAAARSVHPAPPSVRRRELGFGAGLVGGAALAFAAAAALYLTVRHEQAAPMMSATAREPSPPAAPAERPAAAAGAAVVPAAAMPAASAASAAAPLPLDSLPAMAAVDQEQPARAATSASKGLAFRVGERKGDALVLQQRNDAVEPGEAPVAAAEKDAPAEASNAAAKKAAGPRPAATSAVQAGGALPDRPSLGAVQAAIGSVMMGARSCLAGQDEGSRATLVFGADGRVKSVAVAGAAAGTPAEGCVRSALSAARVPAFADPTFSASFTVRPP